MQLLGNNLLQCGHGHGLDYFPCILLSVVLLHIPRLYILYTPVIDSKLNFQFRDEGAFSKRKDLSLCCHCLCVEKQNTYCTSSFAKTSFCTVVVLQPKFLHSPSH